MRKQLTSDVIHYIFDSTITALVNCLRITIVRLPFAFANSQPFWAREVEFEGRFESDESVCQNEVVEQVDPKLMHDIQVILSRLYKSSMFKTHGIALRSSLF